MWICDTTIFVIWLKTKSFHLSRSLRKTMLLIFWRSHYRMTDLNYLDPSSWTDHQMDFEGVCWNVFRFVSSCFPPGNRTSLSLCVQSHLGVFILYLYFLFQMFMTVTFSYWLLFNLSWHCIMDLLFCLDDCYYDSLMSIDLFVMMQCHWTILLLKVVHNKTFPLTKLPSQFWVWRLEFNS